MDLKRYVPAAILAVGLCLAVYFDIHKFLSLETVSDTYGVLKNYIAGDYVFSLFLFSITYIFIVAFSIPGASILSLLFGALLGTLVSGTLIVISATIGATFLFLAAKYALKDTLKKRAGPWLLKMHDGFNENALSYLLFLRFVPLFPFFVVNLVPAFMNVSLRLYIGTTFIGIIPGTFVYASIGNGIGYILEKGQNPNLSILSSTQTILPLAALGLLSLVPIVYKKLKGNRKI